MDRKQRTIFIIAGVVLLAQLASYLFSKSNLDEYYNKFNTARNKIDSIRVKSIGSEQIQTEIEFENINHYVETYNQQHPLLVQLKSNLENGDGLAFWFTEERSKGTTEINQYLKTQDSLTFFCTKVLELTKVHQENKLKIINKAKQHIDKSKHLITRPLQDEEDFNEHIGLLRKLYTEINVIKEKMIKEKSSIKLSGLTETIQASILNSMINTFLDYQLLVKEQEAALIKETALLHSHKTENHKTLFDDLMSAWKQAKLISGEFFAEDSCNMEYFRNHENTEGWGIPKEFNYLYGDLNNDLNTDALVYFYSFRCDGGNARGSLYEIILLSNAADYNLDEDYFKSFILDGMIGWDSIANGTIYGTQSRYGDNDPNCCPSIKSKIVINFNSKKIELSKSLEYTHYVHDVRKDINDPFLNVRSSPSVYGELIKKLPEQAKIILLESGYGNAGQWSKIQFSMNSNDIGYVNKKYISPLRN